MRCPKCDYHDSKVVDSRPADNKIRRRRECLNPECKERFTTYELIEDFPLLVSKKEGSLEPFDSKKLMDRILRATAKRPKIKLKTVENIVEGIEAELKNSFRREAPSSEIGEIVLRKLKSIDHVAYVRFASVYKEFDDVESFIKIITELHAENSK